MEGAVNLFVNGEGFDAVDAEQVVEPLDNVDMREMRDKG
jgi:hypothetical protein